eukprot:XP_016658294.1 PREDICTED: uncharacterized protein LOC100162803 isoform X3 [Acyrthosiphon pisum]
MLIMLLIPRILVVVAVMLTVTNFGVIAPRSIMPHKVPRPQPPIKIMGLNSIINNNFGPADYFELFMKRHIDFKLNLREWIRHIKQANTQLLIPSSYVNQKVNTTNELDYIDENLSILHGRFQQICEDLRGFFQIPPVDQKDNCFDLFGDTDSHTKFISNLREKLRQLKEAQSGSNSSTIVNQKVNNTEMLENSDHSNEFLSNLQGWLQQLNEGERQFFQILPVDQKQNLSKPDTTHEEAHGQVLPTFSAVPIEVDYSKITGNRGSEFKFNLTEWIRQLKQAQRRLIPSTLVNQKNSKNQNKFLFDYMDEVKRSVIEQAQRRFNPTTPANQKTTKYGPPQSLEFTTRSAIIDRNTTLVGLQQNSSEPNITLKESHGQVLPTVPVVSNKTPLPDLDNQIIDGHTKFMSDLRERLWQLKQSQSRFIPSTPVNQKKVYHLVGRTRISTRST